MMFEDDPLPRRGLVRAKGAEVQSPAHKAFTRLIQQVEKRRERLGQWDIVIPRYRQQYGRDLMPLIEKSRDLDLEWLFALDAALMSLSLTQTERRKLSRQIIDFSFDLLELGCDDPEVKRIYNDYTDSDYDEETSEELGIMKALFEENLGLDLGDVDELRNGDDLMHRLREEMRAKEEARAEAKARKKKTKKQQAKEDLKLAEEKLQVQSLREIFRKLASALHPDREQDPKERERKTQLMQKANEAYERGALLELLELQLEVDRLHVLDPSSLSSDRIQQYTQLLKGQVKELDAELLRIEHGMIYEFGLSNHGKLDPLHVLDWLKQDIHFTQLEVRKMEVRLEEAQDPKKLKAWLKTIKASRRRETDHYDFNPFF